MGMRINVQKLAEILSPAYQAVDVRVAATNESSVWTNAMAVVRLSRQSPDAVREHHQKLEQLHGKVVSKQFRIALGALPFSDWPAFLTSCSEGTLTVGEIAITWPEPIKVADQSGYIQPYHHQLRADDSWNWPSFEACCGRYHQERLGREDLSRELSAIGWSSPSEAINTLCEINTAPGTPHAFDLCVGIPVFALIDSLVVSTAEDLLRFRYLHYDQVKGLRVLARLKVRTNQGERVRTRLDLVLEEDASENQIAIASGRASLNAANRDELVEVKVTHDELGEIYSFQDSVRRLIPEAEQNVLYAALKKFCPGTGFENLLVRPHAHKAKRLKPSSAFELHVSWVLSLCGLSPVVLGEYEQLLAEETNIERASVDILAGGQGQNILVAAACTLGTPKEEDFTNLAHACEILRREVFNQTSVSVYPVIFTGAVGQPSCRDLADAFSTIPIIDADRLAIVVELLNEGMQRFVLDFIGNPLLGDLHSPKLV